MIVDSLPETGFLAGSFGTIPNSSRRNFLQRSKMVRWANVVWSQIGDSDDRQIDAKTTKIPERLICALDIHSSTGLSHGTGWLAGPNLIVTCGHCVFHPQNLGGWASSITVTPGLYEASKPYGSFSSATLMSAPQWIAGQSKGFDIGAIKLNDNVGDRIGWFGIAAKAPADLIGKPVTVAGYPDFDNVFTRQLTHQDKIVAVADGRLYHAADTGPGDSGAPVWIDSAAGPTVIGIHAYEEEQTPAQFGEANSATQISGELLGLIENWRGA